MSFELLLQVATLGAVCLNLAVFAARYGGLVERVDQHERRLGDLEEDLGQVDKRVDDFGKSLFDRILKSN